MVRDAFGLTDAAASLLVSVYFLTGIVLAAGAAVYPLLGGYLATVSWNAPFVAYLLGLPVAAFAWIVLPETATVAGERPSALRNR